MLGKIRSVRVHEVAGSLQPSKWLHVVENQGERCEFLLVCVPLGDYDVVEGDDGQDLSCAVTLQEG